MMVMTTLDPDEMAALQRVPGHSDRQRLRWLVKFWQATIAEKDKREAAERKAAEPKLELVQP